MRRAFVVIVLLELVAILSTTAGVAAEPGAHGRSGGARSGGHRGFHSHGHGHGHSLHHRGPSFHKDGFGRHRSFPRHFRSPGIVIASPLVVYAPPLLEAPPPYYRAPVYAPPVHAPLAVYSSLAIAQPAPPAPPRVVEYATGRYELRGDGIATPYTWVWIPNPPSAPPAPPAAPPAAAPDAPPTSRETLPAREQVYQWTDEQGVAHWTNRVDRVPRRYREAQR